MHCRLSERPANLNTKYKNKGRNSNQSLPIAGPKEVTRDSYSPSGLATIVAMIIPLSGSFLGLLYMFVEQNER